MSFGSLSGAAIEALNRGRRSPAACTTPARAASRRTTARAASWSSRSARPTSAAATRTGASTWRGSRTSSASAPVRRSRSS
jgi:hypothetical protein